ncbi:MAG: hypothetical protein H6555_04205 [Lewinellaceae bacterium]|nr:hypothetical protein [Lewinellaceae bacterium]
MWVWVLLLILGVGLVWLLFAPWILIINSTRRQYRLTWRSVGYVEIIPEKDDLLISLWWWFGHRQWSLLRLLAQRPRSAEKQPRALQKAKAKRSRWGAFRRWRRVLTSFQVRRWWLNIDTNDYVLNAYLFPVLYLLPFTRQHLNINFQQQFDVEIDVRNSLGRVLWAFFNPFLHD